jgi:hypothetical protein
MTAKQESQLTLSLVGFFAKGDWCRWKWWWWVRTNKADHKSMWQRFWVWKKQCSGLRWKRWWGDKDGQLGNIICPSWDLHLSVRYSGKSWLTMKHTILSLLFCDWGRQIKLRFFLFSRHYNYNHVGQRQTKPRLFSCWEMNDANEAGL